MPAPSAASTGTPLPTSIDKVAASCAASRTRMRRPTIGRRNKKTCRRRRDVSFRISARKTNTPTPAARIHSHHVHCKNVDNPNSARVNNGRVCLVASNTPTTCGTTYNIKPTTTSKHIAMTIIG